MNSSISIICSVIIFLFPYIGKLWFNRSILSSTVVSLGLLGTFGGIFVGLLDFDANNIEMAIPLLLEGLKTAFLTSIAGMCSSLLLRLCPAFYGIKDEKTQESESEINLLLTALTNIEEKLQRANENSAQQLSTLNTSFCQFSQQVTDLNVKTMLAALEKVLDTWDSQMTGSVNKNLLEINHSVTDFEHSQISHMEILQTICSEIQTKLEKLNENSQTLGSSIHESISLHSKQGETVTVQMSNLGNLLKNSESQLEQKLTHMEEKFNRELSAMEQFSRTLITIVNKLAQDHDVISKRQKEEL